MSVGNKVLQNLKLSVTRLNIQCEKRKQTIVKSTRDVAEALQKGQEDRAKVIVENVIREEFLNQANGIVKLFCEILVEKFVTVRMSKKECPGDLKEAVCTIIWAAPELQIKELLKVRKAFGVMFGKKFCLAASHNEGNCANNDVVTKLRYRAPDERTRIQFLNEIAYKHGIDWKKDLPNDPTQILQQVKVPSSVGIIPVNTGVNSPPRDEFASLFGGVPPPQSQMQSAPVEGKGDYEDLAARFAVLKSGT